MVLPRHFAIYACCYAPGAKQFLHGLVERRNVAVRRTDVHPEKNPVLEFRKEPARIVQVSREGDIAGTCRKIAVQVRILAHQLRNAAFLDRPLRIACTLIPCGICTDFAPEGLGVSKEVKLRETLETYFKLRKSLFVYYAVETLAERILIHYCINTLNKKQFLQLWLAV